MRIMVQAATSKAAAAIDNMRNRVRGLRQEIDLAGAQTPLGQQHLRELVRFGNQLQWTGRMIQYNFTLPLAVAGTAATMWAMENEKAMTRVVKVYGDLDAASQQVAKSHGRMTATQADVNEATQTFRNELEALEDAFVAISNHYGVAQKDVLEVAGAWAAAGQSGLDLAKSVDLTMKAIIIGDMNATEATKALISVQAQYNLDTQGLITTLAKLNAVENATGASMNDLIVGFQRSAGVARSAGVDVNHLAAYIAALVPAAGSAANAGNALKTIMSRLLAPTKESSEVMNAMGLNLQSTAWQSATVTERLSLMADAFEGLSTSQKNVVSSVVASRWQVNKFDILMREITSTTGFYAKALDAVDQSGNKATDIFARMNDELNAVLESDPRKLERMWVIIQNASAQAIQPLIPYIIYLAQVIGDIATAFSNLNPELQKLILFAAVVLALLGPIIRYMGALATLLHLIGYLFAFTAARVLSLGKVFGLLLAPIAAVIAILKTALVFALSAFVAGMYRVLGLNSAMVAFTGVTQAWAVANTLIWMKLYQAIAGFSAAAAATQVRIWAAAFAGMLTAQAARFTLLLASAKVFFLKWKLLWIAATLSSTSVWGAMWLMIVNIAKLGWMRLIAVNSVAAATMRIFAVVGAAWVAAATLTWTRLVVIFRAGWASLIALNAAMSIASVNIFTRLRTTMMVIWLTMAGGIATIWRGMALASLAAGRLISGNLILGMVRMFKALGPMLLKAAMFLTSPWGIAIAAVLALLVIFRDQIAQVWDNIVGYFSGEGNALAKGFESLINGIIGLFHKLPQGVQDAMMAVVEVVKAAALAVYDWFSYINPFAHHSPSLVENVDAGMIAVLSSFGKLRGLKGILTNAYSQINKFGKTTRGIGASSAAIDMAEDRKSLRKAGGASAVDEYNALVATSAKLTARLGQVNAMMQRQEAVVSRLEGKLAAANTELDKQQRVLDKLNARLTFWQDQLDAAESRLDMFANAPLKGMQAMEDQIHANQMAQNKLRLEMMKFEDVNGTFDEIKGKIEAINGAQELLRGTQADLRSAGAGSEILSQYDQQLAKLDQQKDKYKDAADTLADMQARLDELQRAAERLDLVKAMKFEDLQYQIDKAANSVKEMSFDEIIAGITTSKNQMATYGAKVDEITAKIKDQEKVVASATATRDAIQVKLDKQQKRLEDIRSVYDGIKQAITDIDTALNDVLQSAGNINQATEAAARAKESAAAKKAKAGAGAGAAAKGSPGLQNFKSAAGGNFPDVGGAGLPTRDDWADQSDAINKWTEDLAKETSDAFAAINPFGSIKKKAQEFWGWLKKTGKDAWGGITDFFGSSFGSVDWGSGNLGKVWDGLKDGAQGAMDLFTEVMDFLGWIFGAIWRLLGPEVKQIGKGIWDGLKSIWEQVAPELEKFGQLFGPIGKIIKQVWAVAKPVLAVLVGALLGLAKVAFSIIADTIGPLFKSIGTILAGVISVIRGVVEIIVGIFTLDLGLIVDGVKSIFGGLGKIIWGLLKGAWALIRGVVVGIVTGIVDFFVWLWDELVGHSIVPDIVDGIIYYFKLLASLPKWVWNNVLKPVYDFFVSVWKKYIKPALETWWSGIKKAWDGLKSAAKWMWDNTWGKVISGVKSAWSNHVRPALASWWAGIKKAWDGIKSAYKWLWDNSWGRVISGVKNLWSNHVRPELGRWWDRIKSTWGSLKSLGTWFKDNVMDKVLDRVKRGWTAVRSWVSDRADWIVAPFKGVVRGVVNAVNWIIKGINKLDALPGVEIKVGTISLPRGFASGTEALPTRRSNRGFMTRGARAIVGEGKQNYPEFVIPTDPTYRQRALGLLSRAASKLGVASGTNSFGAAGDTASDAFRYMRNKRNAAGVPMYDIGGVLGKVGSTFVNLKDKVAKGGKDILGLTMKPFIGLANKAADRIDWSTGRQVARGAIRLSTDWLTEANKEYAKDWEKNAGGGPGVQNALRWARQQEGKPYIWGGVGPAGYDCSGFMSAITNVIRGKNPYSRLGATATFPWSGFSTMGPYAPKGFTIGSSMSYAGGIGHMAGTLGGVNVESRGGEGVVIGSRARGYLDGGFTTRASLTGLKYGGIVRRRIGGQVFKLGEGGQDEAVTPLPRNWKADGLGGKKEYNFYGDLVFPNVTDGNDAKAFLDNLSNLAKD